MSVPSGVFFVSQQTSLSRTMSLTQACAPFCLSRLFACLRQVFSHSPLYVFWSTGFSANLSLEISASLWTGCVFAFYCLFAYRYLCSLMPLICTAVGTTRCLRPSVWLGSPVIPGSGRLQPNASLEALRPTAASASPSSPFHSGV